MSVQRDALFRCVTVSHPVGRGPFQRGALRVPRGRAACRSGSRLREGGPLGPLGPRTTGRHVKWDDRPGPPGLRRPRCRSNASCAEADRAPTGMSGHCMHDAAFPPPSGPCGPPALQGPRFIVFWRRRDVICQARPVCRALEAAPFRRPSRTTRPPR